MEPPPFIKGEEGRVGFSKSLSPPSPPKKGGRSDFFHKNGGVGKIGGVVLKKEEGEWYHLFSY